MAREGKTVSDDSPSARILPFHAAIERDEGSEVCRLPGRPRKVAPAPVLDEVEYHRQVAVEREAFIADDHLVRTCRATAGNERTAAVLDGVRVGLATEAAGLRWDRERAEERGRELAGQLASRRIDALGKLAALELERTKLGVHRDDPCGPKVQTVFRLFFAEVVKAARDVLPESIAEDVNEKVAAALVGWESRI